MTSWNPTTWPGLRLLQPQHRVLAVIFISSCFFVLEIAIGFRNRSLALVADAFHIFSDLIGYVIALMAIRLKASSKVPSTYSFGYQKAEVLGAFFNGVFLVALGVSVILQSIERFISPSEILEPVLVMAVGAAGVGSNIVMVIIMGGHSHGEHSHSHGEGDHAGSHDHSHAQVDDHPHDTAHALTPHFLADHQGHAHAIERAPMSKTSRFDLNILGIFIHILGDAVNSVAVIVSAGIYLATGFVYCDPIASTFVGIMIISTSLPLVLRSGKLLLEKMPESIDIKGVTEDVERITGEGTVHELHIWNITQSKTLATMHLSVENNSLSGFIELAQSVRQCLHFWGIHVATIQPELLVPTTSRVGLVHDVSDVELAEVRLGEDDVETRETGLRNRGTCMIKCKSGCEADECC